MFETWDESVAKPGENSCEDRCRVKTGLLAVSDGAGGTGIFAGEWAECLLENLPPEPFLDEQALAEWLEGIWEPFYSKYEKLCTDSSIRSKFLEEGSYATLAALWLTPEKNGYRADYRIFGDSVVLVFQPEQGLVFCSHPDLRIFTKAPDLLNWNAPPALSVLLRGGFSIAAGSIVLLCSDALAQYLLLTHALTSKTDADVGQLSQIRAMPVRLAALLEQLEDAEYGQKDWHKDVLVPLLDAAKDKDDFRAYLYDLAGNGYIAIDDFTLVAAMIQQENENK